MIIWLDCSLISAVVNPVIGEIVIVKPVNFLVKIPIYESFKILFICLFTIYINYLSPHISMHGEMTFRNHQAYSWGQLERDNALRRTTCYTRMVSS